MRTASVVASLWLALGAQAAEPTPPDREVPPNRGRLFLYEKDYQRVMNQLRDPATPLDKRIEVIGVLALTREPRAVPELVRMVTTGKERMALKVAALWALGEIGDPRGMVALQFALSRIYLKDPVWTKAPGLTTADGRVTPLRRLCEAQLAKLAEKVVAKLANFVLSPLSGEPSQPSRKLSEKEAGRMRAALVSLAAVGDGDPAALDALSQVLRADDNRYPPDFKLIAAEALGGILIYRHDQFKDLEAKDPIQDEILAAMVEAAVGTSVPGVRELVGSVVRRVGMADRVAKRLVYFLEEPNLPREVRYHAVETLAFVRSPVAADQLVFFLFDRDPGMRWRAAVALGTCGDRRAVKFLREFLKDPSPFVRMKAAAALGHLGVSSAVPDLAVALTDPEKRVRRHAALALGRTREEAALPALIKQGLKDPAPSVRAASAVAIGMIGRSAGLKHVAQLMQDKDRGVRLVAAEVLSRFLNPGATRALVTALADLDPGVRQVAVRALSERLAGQPATTIELVVEAIADGKGCRAAAECLIADYRKARATRDDKRLRVYQKLVSGKGGGGLGAALAKAIADRDPRAREVAAKLMVELGWDFRSRPLLERAAGLADDPDRGVRSVALMARNYLDNLR